MIDFHSFFNPYSISLLSLFCYCLGFWLLAMGIIYFTSERDMVIAALLGGGAISIFSTLLFRQEFSIWYLLISSVVFFLIVQSIKRREEIFFLFLFLVGVVFTFFSKVFLFLKRKNS